jgi:hypothetical protein
MDAGSMSASLRRFSPSLPEAITRSCFNGTPASSNWEWTIDSRSRPVSSGITTVARSRAAIVSEVSEW